MNKPKDNRSVHSDLRPSVENSTFVPFIGPDASVMRRSSCKGAWVLVSNRLAKLLFRITASNSSDKQSEIKYLRSLAKAYQFDNEFRKLEKTLMTKDNEVLAENHPENHLSNLRYYLVRAGSSLVGLFGIQMIEQRPCVEDLPDYRVNIHEKRDEIQQTLEYLNGALDATCNYMNCGQGNQFKKDDKEAPQLDADIIYEKLLLLASRLGSSLEDGIQEILGRHYGQIQEKGIAVDQDEVGYLRLDELAWLEDLLWHTLRFDVPDYLNTNEMTFRLSLLTGEIRRELLQIVASSPSSEIAAYLEEWIKKCEKENHPSRLHVFIAAALWLKFEKSFKVNHSIKMMPVVFTTNFDRNLELALKTLKKPYHIIFPLTWKAKSEADNNDMLMKDKDRDSREPPVTTINTSHQLNIEWVLKTVDQNGEQADLIKCPQTSGEFIKEEIIGPVIVKLHGSPAESYSKAKIGKTLKLERAGEVSHYVILSEYDYLRTAIQTESVFPRTVVDLFKAGKNWWFLGYPIDDLFMRLRIFQILSYTFEAEAQEKPSVKALDPDYDLLRTNIFHMLNVHRLDTSLGVVLSELEKIPEIKAIIKEANYDVNENN